jgi:hypothetical protein
MLETFEILDRFELLYPDNENLSDLRRSYIDQDLSSIFRIANSMHVSGNLEDLRKAVIEKNLHSIFRLIDDEDLRKLILEDNIWKLWPVLERYTDTQFVSAFKNFFVNQKSIDKDCFSRGQLQSKIWLVNELKKLDLSLGTVYLCAGWYATLAVMLFESGIKVDKIRSFDIDPSTVDIAESFNKPWYVDQWRFKALCQDIMQINYNSHTWQFWSNANNRLSYPITDIPDTIINTSCEHITNFNEWYNKIPSGKIIILQGNNYFEIKEHVNCSFNLDEFSQKAPMTTVLYEGALSLPKYTRFMKIGIR